MVWHSSPRNHPGPDWDYAYTLNERAFVVKVWDNVVYVGAQLLHTATTADTLLIALDADNGHFLWSETFAGPGGGLNEIDGIVVDTDWIYVSGWVNAGGDNGQDVFVAKYRNNGTAKPTEFSWNHWGPQPNKEDYGNGHMVGDTTHLYVAGCTDCPGDLKGEAFLAVFNKSDLSLADEVRWLKPGMEWSNAFSLETDGTYFYMVGAHGTGLENRAFVMAFDKGCSQRWSDSAEATEWGYGTARGHRPTKPS